MTILGRVERHLHQSGEKWTQFGRRVARDPRLVRDLRNGREPRAKLTQRILEAIETGAKS